ncbi:hypothetical protein [Citrobacter koseri]|uniref:hypothetical protein n=1 Tax=Citrobacter koseri TaxID=545 RepID=UPI0019070A89|nr:hypothetical protein [Citrobacter koseri]MBJ8809864.1 hypothetical protein [Citrobacter koseri]
MTTITRERLEWLSNISGRDDIEDIDGDEIRELARIALASLDAGSNSHPAHGTLSNDRLQRISDILSKAAAQSDGGNLGYAMSDAVKAIDELLAGRKAEPVAWTEKCEISNMQATGLYLRGFPDNSQGRDIALYTAPPAPVVPDEMAISDDMNLYQKSFAKGHNACRAAIIKHGGE